MTTTLRRPRLGGEANATRRPRPRRQVRSRQRGRLLALNGATIVALAALVLGVIAILYLFQTSQVAELGYQLSYLQKQQDELTNQNALLAYQDDSAHAVNVVDQIAVSQLGMVPMRSFQYLTVQRPAQTELPAVPADPSVHASLMTRIRRALEGSSQAAHPASKPAPAVNVNADGTKP
jgi:cell division protein FtsL